MVDRIVITLLFGLSVVAGIVIIIKSRKRK